MNKLERLLDILQTVLDDEGLAHVSRENLCDYFKLTKEVHGVPDRLIMFIKGGPNHKECLDLPLGECLAKSKKVE